MAKVSDRVQFSIFSEIGFEKCQISADKSVAYKKSVYTVRVTFCSDLFRISTMKNKADFDFQWKKITYAHMINLDPSAICLTIWKGAIFQNKELQVFVG